jgi:hypothetical protein
MFQWERRGLEEEESKDERAFNVFNLFLIFYYNLVVLSSDITC